jgi:hypothetical protein
MHRHRTSRRYDEVMARREAPTQDRATPQTNVGAFPHPPVRRVLPILIEAPVVFGLRESMVTLAWGSWGPQHALAPHARLALEQTFTLDKAVSSACKPLLIAWKWKHSDEDLSLVVRQSDGQLGNLQVLMRRLWEALSKATDPDAVDAVMDSFADSEVGLISRHSEEIGGIV